MIEPKLSPEQVEDPKREKHIAHAVKFYRRLKEADQPVMSWGYVGLFYSDSTQPGAREGLG